MWQNFDALIVAYWDVVPGKDKQRFVYTHKPHTARRFMPSMSFTLTFDGKMYWLQRRIMGYGSSILNLYGL